MASAQDARRGAPEGSKPRRVAVVPEGLTAHRFDTASSSDQSPEVEGGFAGLRTGGPSNHKRAAPSKGGWLSWRCQALKGKPHERYRHETRPEDPAREQAVKRLRKPEGGTKRELATPWWWTLRISSAGGARNLMRGASWTSSGRDRAQAGNLLFGARGQLVERLMRGEASEAAPGGTRWREAQVQGRMEFEAKASDRGRWKYPRDQLERPRSKGEQ
jgi:hypothetical protein